MIRAGTKVDVPAIVGLGRSLIGDSLTLRLSPFDLKKTTSFVFNLLNDVDGIVLVKEVDCRIVGAMLGFVMEQPFSTERQAADFGLYVEHGSRGHLYGKQLIKEFERQAKLRGAVTFGPGVMTGVIVGRVTKLYERLGYQVIGTQLYKRL